MLVLALEFSRGCTVHAGVRYHTAREQLRSGTTTRPGHARGAWSPPALEDAGTGAGKRAQIGGAPEGLDSKTGTDPPPGSHEHQRDVTGIDPKGRSLKTE
jgi:hypothetical protein